MQKNQESVSPVSRSVLIRASAKFPKGPRARGAGLGSVCLSAAGISWAVVTNHPERSGLGQRTLVTVLQVTSPTPVRLPGP